MHNNRYVVALLVAGERHVRIVATLIDPRAANGIAYNTARRAQPDWVRTEPQWAQGGYWQAHPDLPSAQPLGGYDCGDSGTSVIIFDRGEAVTEHTPVSDPGPTYAWHRLTDHTVAIYRVGGFLPIPLDWGVGKTYTNQIALVGESPEDLQELIELTVARLRAFDPLFGCILSPTGFCEGAWDVYEETTWSERSYADRSNDAGDYRCVHCGGEVAR